MEEKSPVKEGMQIPDMKPNVLYRIRARNAYLGVWIPEKQGFVILRTKFGSQYPFVEYHWDTGSPFGTVIPQEELADFPVDVQGDFDEAKFKEAMKEFYEKYPAETFEQARERIRKERESQ